MFDLEDLPFSFDSFESSLEKVLSKESFEYHFGKHHKAYVNNLNKLLPLEWAGKSLEEVEILSKKNNNMILFNNAAQHWNHSFFWQSITPEKVEISAELKACIEGSFGSIENCLNEMSEIGLKLFGSGWVWLSYNKEKRKIEIIQTFNADNLLAIPNLVPLLVCDVWEHAYYIDYRNKRDDYLKCILNNHLNWKHASNLFRNLV